MNKQSKPTPRDQVFVRFERGVATWYACVAGTVVAASWASKGAAQAGMQVEQRRYAAKAARAKEAEGL